MGHSKDKDIYSNSYPETGKWLNICIVCQTEGYKPELPEKIYPGALAQHIRKYWDELEVNELGICNQCSKHIK